MSWWGWLLLIAVVVVAAVLIARARSGGAKPATSGPGRSAPPRDPLAQSDVSDPRRIAVGDLVKHDGRDWIVRGTITASEGGETWHEHLLDDGTLKRWLSVETGEGEPDLVLWERLVAPDLVPGPAQVAHADVVYTLEEHGSASFTATGSTGTGASGDLEYYDYARGEQRLAFERTSARVSWEISVGHVVRPSELDVFHSSPS